MPLSLQRWSRSCSSAAERATPPHGWKHQSHQRKWPGRRSRSYGWESFSIPKSSNRQLPAAELWCLCSSLLTSDALIQAPAICTCLEGKCWPSIPRPDTNQAHFNVNNHPRRGSMINVSFSCHGLIPNPGDCTALQTSVPGPVLPSALLFHTATSVHAISAISTISALSATSSALCALVTHSANTAGTGTLVY